MKAKWDYYVCFINCHSQYLYHKCWHWWVLRIKQQSWLGRNRNICSVQFSCLSVMSHSLQLHELQHARLPCPSPTPRACSNSWPSGRWCHPIISPSVVPFSCLQFCPALGSFPMSQFFASGGQSIGASTSLWHQSFQWIFRTDFI